MTSLQHELLVEIVREHPDLVLELLRVGFGMRFPGAIEVAAATENLTHIQLPERRADAVLVLRNEGDPQPVHALVVEVQLRPDLRKRLSWPVYVTVLRARRACPVTLVVLAVDDATARWCAAPIALDDHGSVLRPRVIGPALVPIVDVEAAHRHPELAVISFLAHKGEPVATEIGRALLAACEGLDESRRALYSDVVFSFINEAARHALEAEMNVEKFLPELKRIFEARAEARGHAQGRVETLAQAVLKVLEARGLPISDDHRATIRACTDPDELDTWLEFAVTAQDADQIFTRR